MLVIKLMLSFERIPMVRVSRMFTEVLLNVLLKRSG